MEKQGKQACCWGKDDDVDNNDDDGDDDSDHGCDIHVTHLTQVENNGNLIVCDKNLTYVVKNTLTSLISDVI
eukprot:5741020-Ditylum_brightwellii.AAC.1